MLDVYLVLCAEKGEGSGLMRLGWSSRLDFHIPGGRSIPWPSGVCCGVVAGLFMGGGGLLHPVYYPSKPLELTIHFQLW